MFNRASEPRLCVITDRRRLSPGARTTRDELTVLEQFIGDAIEAGVDLVQIRERDLDARLIVEVARKAIAGAAGGPTRIIVNDRADVALAANADGVHVPALGVSSLDLREIGPPGWTIGRSVHSTAECAAERGADYLLFGTVFASASKRDEAPQGIDALKRAVSAAHAPVLAIGGITPARARQCLDAGAAGVAAIGIFLPEGREPGSLGLREAVGEFRAAFRT